MFFKKVFILSFLFLVFIPIGSVFAAESQISTKSLVEEDDLELDYKNGLLDQPDLIKENTFPKEIYDNDLDSRVSQKVYSNKYVEFNAPIDIGYLYFKGDNSYYNNFLIVEFANGEVLEDISIRINNGGYYEVDFKDVVKITLKRPGTISGTLYLNEIDFFEKKQGEQPEIPPLDEVEDLKVEAEHNRVDLSWTLPESEGFKHVNIYRDEIKEEPSLIKRFFSGDVAYAAATPIFETNGTYFNDRTVQPATNYEYTLTTTDGERESSGVTIEVLTPGEPPPKMGGVDGSKQENGDYLYTWETPTDGKVKIIVGGREYATVPAGDGSFTVPADDMAYTPLGDPDVGLRPISPTGVEGEETSASSELEPPFDAKDLVETGSGLLWIISPFLLLALAFLLVPKLRNLIISAFKSKQSEDVKTDRRDVRETRIPRGGRRTG